MTKKWVRFNAINGVILEEVKVSSDDIKKDINGYDEVTLNIPAYTLSDDDRLEWASTYFRPWSVGVALIDEETSTVETAGIVVKRGFMGSSEMITVTAYNVMEYLKKLRVPAIYSNITSNGTITVSGETFGELYAEAIRAGMNMTGAPAGTTYYSNFILTPKTGTTISREIKRTDQQTVYGFITDLRDGEETKGEEIRFVPTLDVANSKIMWTQTNGMASQPHINGNIIVEASTLQTSGTPGNTWKVAEYTWDDDGTTIFNRLIINGSSDEEEPFIGVGSKTDPNTPTLTEAFDSGTDLSPTQMTEQLQARLTGSMLTGKTITVTIEEDEAEFWRTQIGVMLLIHSGEKTAGAGVYGRVVEISWSSVNPGQYELSVAPPSSRYPKLPSQKERETIGGGDSGGTGGFDNGDLPDLDGGGWGPTTPLPDGTFPTPGDPDFDGGGWEDGGITQPMTITGTVFDISEHPYYGVTVRAWTDAGFTTAAGSTVTASDGTYTLNLNKNTQYWLTAHVGTFTQPHPNNPISVVEDPIEQVDFHLPISNPLKLYKISGRMMRTATEPQINGSAGIWPSRNYGHGGSRNDEWFRALTSLTIDSQGYYSGYVPNGSYAVGYIAASSQTNAYWCLNFLVNGEDYVIGNTYPGVVKALGVEVGDKIVEGIKVEAYSDPQLENLLGWSETQVRGFIQRPYGFNYGGVIIYLPYEYSGPVYYKATHEGKVALAGKSEDLREGISFSPVTEVRVKGRLMLNATTPAVGDAYFLSAQNLNAVGGTAANRRSVDIVQLNDGYFDVHLPAGTFNIRATQGSNTIVFTNIRVLDSDLNIGVVDYSKNATIVALAVVNGKPIPGIDFNLTTDSGTFLGVSDEQGNVPFYVQNWAGFGTVNKTYAGGTRTFYVYGAGDYFSLTAPAGKVTGTVYNVDGVTPVGSGVQVFASADVYTGQAVPAVHTTVTDANGTFTFTGMPTTEKWVIRTATSEFKQTSITTGDTVVDLTQIASGVLGSVAVSVTANNKPVQGGTVRVYSDPEYSNLVQTQTFKNNNGVNAVFSTETTTYGAQNLILRINLPVLYVEAEHEGFTARKAVDVPTTGYANATLKLAETYTVSGTVFGVDGVTPVGSGIVVTAHSNTFTGGPMANNSVTTNADGKYSINLPPGKWVVHTDGSEIEQITVTEQINNHDLTYLPGLANPLGNRVLVKIFIGTLSVMGGTVNVYSDPDYTDLIQTQTFNNNVAADSNTNQQSYPNNLQNVILSIDPTLYPMLFIEVEKNGAIARKSITNPTTGWQIVKIYLSETYTVSGTVFDTDGVTPLVGTAVNVHPNGSNTPIIATTTTDANGKYRVDLPKGKYNLKPFGANNTRRKMSFVEIVDANIPNVNFVVGANGANIQGRVTLNGTYFPNEWEVDLNVYSDAGFTNLIATQKLNGGSSATVSYYVSDIPGGTTMYVRAKYAGLEYSYPNPVSPAVGGTTSNVNIDITRTEYTVTGKVKYRSTDEGVTTRPVAFFNNSGYMFGSKTATTDLEGNYTITLPPGTYWVRENASTQYSAPEPVTVGSTNTTVGDIIIGDTSVQVVNLTITSGDVVVAGVEVLALSEDETIIKRTISHNMALTNNAIMRIGAQAEVTTIRVKTAGATYDYRMPATGNFTQKVELPIV